MVIGQRRMKMGIVLLVLCFFLPVFADDPPAVTKVTPDRCDGDMVCFFPGECVGRDATQFYSGPEQRDVTSNCKAIMKIRSYTDAKWLVLLESLDPTVKTIELKQGNAKFLSCSATNSTVTAGYLGAVISGNDRLNAIAVPLKCEFIVTATDKVVPGLGSMTLIADTVQARMQIGFFNEFTKPTCEAEKLSGQITEGVFGETTVAKVGGKYPNLDCPTNYNLEYHYEGETKFETATNITCVSEDDEYGIPIFFYSLDAVPAKPIKSARCAAQVCSMCDYNPTSPSGPQPSVVKVESCKVLKCSDNEAGLGDGSAEPVAAAANCAYDKDQGYVWSIGGMQFGSTTNAKCEAKKLTPDYFKSTCGDPGKGYTKCEIKENRPYCSSGKVQSGDQPGNVTCSDYKGCTFNGVDLAESTLNCGKVEGSGAQTSAAGGLSTGAIVAVIIVVVIVAVTAVFFFFCYRKRKASQQQDTLKTTVSKTQQDSIQSKSKESKKDVVDATTPPPPITTTLPEAPPPQAPPTTNAPPQAPPTATPPLEAPLPKTQATPEAPPTTNAAPQAPPTSTPPTATPPPPAATTPAAAPVTDGKKAVKSTNLPSKVKPPKDPNAEDSYDSEKVLAQDIGPAPGGAPPTATPPTSTPPPPTPPTATPPPPNTTAKATPLPTTPATCVTPGVTHSVETLKLTRYKSKVLPGPSSIHDQPPDDVPVTESGGDTALQVPNPFPPVKEKKKEKKKSTTTTKKKKKRRSEEERRRRRREQEREAQNSSG